MLYKPDWNKDVSPYLVVQSVEDQIAFLTKVFGTQTIEAPKMNDHVFHAELKLGDSVVMIGRASKDFAAVKGNVYVYVPDVRAVHKKALEHGAKTVMEPADMPYGNIESGFTDPQNNTWWLAQLVKPMSEQDITDAMKKAS